MVFSGGIDPRRLRAGAVDLAALLLVGFDGFLRSGELFSLCVGDIHFDLEKAIIKIPASKTGVRRGVTEMIVLKAGVTVRVLRRACRGLNEDDTILR